MTAPLTENHDLAWLWKAGESQPPPATIWVYETVPGHWQVTFSEPPQDWKGVVEYRRVIS